MLWWAYCNGKWDSSTHGSAMNQVVVGWIAKIDGDTPWKIKWFVLDQCGRMTSVRLWYGTNSPTSTLALTEGKWQTQIHQLAAFWSVKIFSHTLRVQMYLATGCGLPGTRGLLTAASVTEDQCRPGKLVFLYSVDCSPLSNRPEALPLFVLPWVLSLSVFITHHTLLWLPVPSLWSLGPN